MSVNRLLKKRQQQAHGGNEPNNVQGTTVPQLMAEAVKMTKQETQLQQQFEKFADYSQYNPSGYNYSNTHMPYTASLYNRFKMPITMVIPPVSYEMDPVQKSIDKIPRCASCRAYMNYYNQVKKNSFVCFICGRQNSFMDHYEIDTESIETSQPSYHVLGGQNVYMQSPPQNAFIFMVDVNSSAAQSKMLYYFVAAVKEVLAKQQFNQTQIYFYTFDDVLHEYDFTGEEIKCTVFDPSIHDSGSRVQQNFLSNIRVLFQRNQEKLFELLDSLQQMAQQNKKQSSNFYQSFAYVFEAVKHTGGKIFILQANEAIAGQNFTNQYLKNANNQVEVKPRSFLQSRNKQFFNTYTSATLHAGISYSFFIFEKNYKNIRIIGDFAKLTSSQILVYKKQNPQDLTKFYYDLSYLLGCPYYKTAIMEMMISPGWMVAAVYGNLYRIKEFISFKVLYNQPSKKAFIILHPLDSYQLPYFAMQVVTNYIYNRQHFVCVNTVVLPLTTSLQKLYSNQDYSLTSASLSRAAISGLRLEQINVMRNKFIRNLAAIWKCANQFYKKKATPEISNVILSQLGLLKSQHFQLDAINDTQALDLVVHQRNILQGCGMNEIQNFFCPYLFNLSLMTEQMCMDEENFIYPDVCELKFNSVKDGIFLLDNGLSLYLYIAKTCDPQLLKMLYGKQKLAKTDHLGEQNFMTNNIFAQQVTNLIRVLREQKIWGWIPLYVVRCGEGTHNQKTFYMNFYAQKYDQFRGCKYTLGEFFNVLNEQY